jgi:hypothetical protein
MKLFTQIFLALVSVVFGLLMLPAGAAAIFSPMAFDSGQTLLTWVLVIAFCSYIPVAACAIASAWALYSKRWYVSSMAVSLLPLVNILVVTCIFVLAPRLGWR